jgi:RNA polymerase sigma-70 factor (ECF subfamily)
VREAVGADQKINYEELRVIVYKALDKLPPKCRAIFILCRFEGMKYKEIAQQLNISVKTVENQMSIAIFKLKGDLKETLKDDYISLLYVLMFIEVNYKIITQFF